MLFIQALGDIEIAMKLLKKDEGSDDNPVDAHYKSLECDLKPLAKTDSDFKVICTFKTIMASSWSCFEQGSASAGPVHHSATKGTIQPKKCFWP
jgi:hypothetical protein